jgi:hypothetical protein|tara:strand:+ start:338 stop:547 length:210 start_codon:yes stop_codon:yes gene_type:complete
VPTYDYQCSACEATYELFESYEEHVQFGIPTCMKCDPDDENPTTMYRYFGNNNPTFKIGGKGVFKPGVF